MREGPQNRFFRTLPPTLVIVLSDLLARVVLFACLPSAGVLFVSVPLPEGEPPRSLQEAGQGPAVQT